MIFDQKVLHDFRPSARLRVTGDDAFGFLQGQFTNELRQPSGSATYGLWLNQKGKVIADSHVLRISEKEFLITSTGSPAGVIRQRLEDYIVADDVAIADETEGAQGLWITGAGSGDVLRRLLGDRPVNGRFVRAEDTVAFCGRRAPVENFEILGSAESLGKMRQAFLAAGWAAAEAASIEFVRISAGIPAVPADLGPGDLPNEGGLDESAISYTKGCYLGQEVMARLKNLGQVRRRLHVVRGRGNAPAPTSAVYQGEKKTGEIRSVAARGDEFVALAMLSLVNLQPDAGLGLEPAGPAPLVIDRHG